MLEITVVCTEPADYAWPEDDPQIQAAVKASLEGLGIGIRVKRIDVDPAQTKAAA